MPAVDVVIQSDIPLSTRARQVCGMFDCPPEKKQTLRWKAELPIEDRDWSIGLIVGPSGCGKTTIARHLWPEQIDSRPDWSAPTVIDAFASTIQETAEALSSVGFGTIPAWLRPYDVLSNGEKFRADIARRLIESSGVIVIDEFTSVVDRQVAKVASHAVQKYVRKTGRQMVAVSCHDDIIEWLQPDWVFRPDELRFDWRLVQRRPEISIEVARIPYEAWRLFAPYHYMSATLHRAAACYGLWADGVLASFCGVMHKPHPKVRNIRGISRIVTLPDYQGIGLAFVLSETLGAAYSALGYRFRNYPAHPAYVRAHRRDRWRVCKAPGRHNSPQGKKTTLPPNATKARPCASLEYIGPKMIPEDARSLIHGEKK